MSGAPRFPRRSALVAIASRGAYWVERDMGAGRVRVRALGSRRSFVVRRAVLTDRMAP